LLILNSPVAVLLTVIKMESTEFISRGCTDLAHKNESDHILNSEINNGR
jgi:hypothetical protein